MKSQNFVAVDYTQSINLRRSLQTRHQPIDLSMTMIQIWQEIMI
jgi:hypothetical protein